MNSDKSKRLAYGGLAGLAIVAGIVLLIVFVIVPMTKDFVVSTDGVTYHDSVKLGRSGSSCYAGYNLSCYGLQLTPGSVTVALKEPTSTKGTSVSLTTSGSITSRSAAVAQTLATETAITATGSNALAGWSILSDGKYLQFVSPAGNVRLVMTDTCIYAAGVVAAPAVYATDISSASVPDITATTPVYTTSNTGTGAMPRIPQPPASAKLTAVSIPSDFKCVASTGSLQVLNKNSTQELFTVYEQSGTDIALSFPQNVIVDGIIYASRVPQIWASSGTASVTINNGVLSAQKL